MNYECVACGSMTALTGSCRGCGAPSEVDGSFTRRIGKSEIERLTDRVALLERLLGEACMELEGDTDPDKEHPFAARLRKQGGLP